MPVHLGLTAKITLVVSPDDTAVAARSGDVPVLSTPRIVALCEEAAITAVEGQLTEGETTVGMRIQLDHLAPSAIGSTVTASAKLEKVEGRRLKFSVSVSDPRGLVAAGKITRVVVERDRFMDKCL
ncbi:MAG TPA: hotdog domain-containing protein [Acidimicrobiales bacterium]|nr:hotdog domain-containing protein [Acidimicrobiales bacterium]